MHGVIMIFFFLIPSIPAVLGNFLVPLMIGARDLAFPKLNLLSWYIYMIGGSIALWILIFGGVDTGWTFYTPFSTMFSNTHGRAGGGRRCSSPGSRRSSPGLNFIVTVHTMRAPGMTWFRLPLFVWSHVRDQPDHGPGHAGAGHHGRRWWPSSGSCRSASSTRPWAATRSCSSTCSGSTRTRRSTSWSCRAWR